MILYTDGVNEAMDINNEQFDYPRFEECIKESYHKTSEEIYNHIYKAILDFRGNAAQSDDITMIILRVLEDFPEYSPQTEETQKTENKTEGNESKSA
jgi:serine phosphatase RsbU (regulator of sigma subunit)